MKKIIFPETFTYSTIYITIQLKSSAILPKYKGSLFRGVLGKTMRHLSCLKKRTSCNECEVVISCPYANLYKPRLILGNQLITVPFVIFSPDNREFLERGETISLQLTLFGDFIEDREFFLECFENARKVGLGNNRARFEIIEIKQGKNGNSTKQSLAGITPYENPVKKLKIRYLSPVSLYKKQKHIYAPRPEEIIEYLVHRINRLNKSIWQVKDYTLDRKIFALEKLNVTHYDIRYQKIFKSKGLGNKVELSGFTGNMEITGPLDMLYPLFRAGEILHIGSRTSYGLGKYEMCI
jgi:CRISPR-associated endoribonuclease Cas6